MGKRFPLLLFIAVCLVLLLDRDQPVFSQGDCSTTFYRWERLQPINLNTSRGGFAICFTITDIPSSVAMLQLEMDVESGRFDVYYRPIASGRDEYQTLSLTLGEPVEGPNVFEFLPFTFGEDALQVSIVYESATTATMNVGFSDIGAQQVRRAGPSTSGELSSAPAQVTIRTVTLERFYDYRVPIAISCPGNVSATARFEGGSRSVMILLKGSGRSRFYDQENGDSPVSLNYRVTTEHLAESRFWQFSLVNWDSNEARNVTLQITTPDCPTAPASSQGASDAPSGGINDVWVDQNVTRDGERGMMIHVDAFQCNLPNVELRTSAYFYFADGDPIPDRNGRYDTSGGNVATGKSFTPSADFECSRFRDVEFFMPYSELEAEPYLGSNDSIRLRFYVRYYIRDVNDEIDRSDWIDFTYRSNS